MKRLRNKIFISLFAILVAISLTFVCGGALAQAPQTSEQTEEFSTASVTTMTAKFLDVREADSCIIRISDGTETFFALVDAGIKGTSDKVVEELQDMGCNELDVLVLTHPDADHVGGSIAVMNTMEVEEVWDPGIDGSNTQTWQEVKAAIAAKGIPRKHPQAGETYDWCGVQTSVLNPPSGAPYSGTNDFSIVLVETLGIEDIMLTGDVLSDAQQFMMGEDFPDIEVFKVPHHGSDSGYYKPFFDKVHPPHSVISVGPNAWGHPSDAVIDALEVFGEVYRTDEDGDIMVFATEDSLQIQTGDSQCIISSISPTYGKPGDSITIYGSGFGTSGVVRFGAETAATTSWTDTRITAIVPSGVVYGKVSVTSIGGSATSDVDFLPVACDWYFAEGYTGQGFQEYLCLGNAGTEGAHARAVYLFSDGTTQEQDVIVGANSRTTIDVNAAVGNDKSVSTHIVADKQIVAERPMYFSYQNICNGGHDAVGATSPANTWYFAEGYTGAGFDEYICVLNPGGIPANLIFRFQTQEEGEKTISGFSVPPHSRTSFKANDLLEGKSYQTSLKLESSQPVVAERPMYFSYQGTSAWGWQGGHCVMGISSLASEYYFAEGTTREAFEEWITLQNPNPNPIEIQATYQLGLGQGAPVSKTYNLAAGTRQTIFVPNEVGIEKDVSVHLSSSDDFLAERPMYFDYSYLDLQAQGGHCVIGATSPATDWFLAEGYTGGGFNQWLCLQNAGTEDATVQVTYCTQEAGALAPKEVIVPAGTRRTIMVNDDAGPNYQLSCGLSSNKPIVLERPMYFVCGGCPGGHDVVGYAP